MSEGLRRVVPKKAVSPTSSPPAEPGKKVIVIIQTLEGLKFTTYGTIELPASSMVLVTDALEAIADTSPEISLQVGRPGTRLLITDVDEVDPEFIGGEFKLERGEVMTVPDAVNFLSQRKPTSAQLLRYYLKQSPSKAFKKFGYTFRDIEDFKRELVGPSGKHLHPVAEANIAWAQANHREPLT